MRKYNRNLRETLESTVLPEALENHVLHLIREGESVAVEFKSTMRMNLKSGKAGKEIELAWLKTVVAFMNSQGGSLLIGVDDEGGVQGIGADGFANDDKCRLHFKNLVHQHVGPEFSRYLHLQIVSIQGEKVLYIECEKSNKPAFLKNRTEEDFFIRSGPSSVKLPGSKVLEYVNLK